MADTVSPAAVGWGNLLVPGLGASLRGLPTRGLIEASSEIGLFYGGTFLTKDGDFRIDGSAVLPATGNVTGAVAAAIMQEVGLKEHMYNTFYHYQQASLDPANAELEKSYEQPLYRGDWVDTLVAPFEWKNLSLPAVYIPIIAGGVYVAATYKGTPYTPRGSANTTENIFYATSSALTLPLGSSFGEEVLFRGFIQREVHHYTHSLLAAIATETALFTLMHPADLRPAAFAGGVYFGLMAHYFEGDLGPGIAAHFWTDFINGVFVYLLFRQASHESVPLEANISIPF